MPYLYVVLAVLLRLLPHPWNVTPMGAMFLFSGATFQRKTSSLLVPLLALVVSDIVVIQFLYGGRHPWFDPFTWLGFVSIGLIGWILRANPSPGRLLAASLAGSLLFFLISNFGVWAHGTLYPHTWSGLLKCYVAAIPFLRNTLLGDLFYAILMFGSYYWLIHPRRTKLAGA
jgi:hypothetical protein